MIRGLNIFSSKIAISEKPQENPVLSAFKDGQVITAKVIHLLPGNQAVFLIGGKQVQVNTSLPFSPGEEIQLSLTRENDRVLLDLIRPDSQTDGPIENRINRLFTRNMAWPVITKKDSLKLFNFFETLSLRSGKADSSLLPDLIEKGGLLLEKKIMQLLVQGDRRQTPGMIKNQINALLDQDLKGLLLTERASAEQGSHASRMVTSVLDILETFQQINQQTSESGKIILPLPFLSESAFKFGQFLLDAGPPDAGTDAGKKSRLIKVSFLLDMSRLGPMRADFSILNRNLSGRFMMSDPQACAWVESCIPDLKERLEKVDFTLLNVACETVPVEKLNETCLIEHLAKDQDNSVLNIVV